ncbi:MAG: hypothetical protein JWQ12_2307 [Glaciihabitans sp.]|nr:hypothetical protein [Glaciihabitans sp.]
MVESQNATGGSKSRADAFSDTLGTLIDSIAAVDRMHGLADAAEAEFIDQVRRFCDAEVVPVPNDLYATWDQKRTAHRTAVTEIAAILRIPERTAEARMAVSELLVHHLHETLEALREGAISYRHVTMIADNAWSMPEAAWPEFERQILPYARRLTAARFDRRARSLREKLHPDSIVERRARSIADRSVEFQAERDGMALLSLYAAAEDVVAIWNRATAMAMTMQGPDEPRTLTQLRADVISDLLLSGEADSLPGGIRPEIALVVPALTLLGMSEEPAKLENYGPFDPDTARRLAVNAPSFTRILTHPETGVTLSVGRDRYRVPADLRRYLRLRDETCRFGCDKSARSCDIDHTDDAQFGGHTAHDNLAHLCQKHHADKHNTGWKPSQLGGGVIEWTSPSGHRYRNEPANILGP